MADEVDTTLIDMVKVKTHRPAVYLPVTERAPHNTARLVLRSFTTDDLAAYHELRTQDEVMIYTMQGRSDANIAETQTKLENFLSPAGDGIYVLAAVVRETGRFIGTVGSHMRAGELNWPVLGYMLRTEAWGKGYATEMTKGFLEVYWSLPREEHLVEMEVDSSTVPVEARSGSGGDGENGPPTVPEKLVAVTLDTNLASQKVLRKIGFKLVKKWVDTENPPLLPLCYAFELERPQ